MFHLSDGPAHAHQQGAQSTPSIAPGPGSGFEFLVAAADNLLLTPGTNAGWGTVLDRIDSDDLCLFRIDEQRTPDAG